MKPQFMTLAALVILLITVAGKTFSQCAPNFNYTVGANGVVTFSCTSVLPNSVQPLQYVWVYGNNKFLYDLGYPGMTTSATYSTNGNYVVQLMVNGIPCNYASTQQTIVVNTASGTCPLIPFWTYTQGVNGVVNFSNTSLGTNSGTTYQWNFGDNSSVSSMSPIHTYSANGQYLVTMTASNGGGCSTTFTAMVNVSNYCAYQASFTYTNSNNGVVAFQSTSTGTTPGTFYFWYFGDGNLEIGGPSTTYTYMTGNYQPKLSIIDNYTMPKSCSDSTSQSISVTNATCNLNANFLATLSSSPGIVNFNSTTTGTTSSTTYTWYMGNNQMSNQTNPSVTFPAAGVYYNTLQVSNGSGCFSNKTQTINVSNLPCTANANFTMLPTSQPQYWTVHPNSAGNILNASWSWGDGTPNSNAMFTSHQYSAAGMYTICLTVTASCGSTAQACSSYSVYKGGASQAIINVNIKKPDYINIDLLTGIDQTQKTEDFSLFPNPTNGELFFISKSGGEQDAEIEVYDLTGNLVYKTRIVSQGQTPQRMDLGALADGIYMLKVSRDNKVYTEKIILKKE